MSRERQRPSEGTEDLTPAQIRIVQEIRRVAQRLGDVRRLSQREFDEHHELGGVTTAGHQFGSWNEAVRAAGLEPYPSRGRLPEPRYTSEELLAEIIRVHRLRGTPPTERWMAKLSKYSLAPYRDRWGKFSTARDAAYARFGRPNDDSEERAG